MLWLMKTRWRGQSFVLLARQKSRILQFGILCGILITCVLSAGRLSGI